MSRNAKLIPNLDQNTTKLLNLTVLQRIDPYVEEILFIAAHVTFYEFNLKLGKWSRKDVEGSLFVVKRSAQPRFQFIVMNRRNTNNLVQNLLGDFEYEVQGPYLLYRNASGEVNGIWFYIKSECEEVANLFNRILSAYSKVNHKPKTSSKSEFEELEALSATRVIDGRPEPSSSPTDVPEDLAFVNFFSSATALGNTSSGSASLPPYQSSAIPIQHHQPTIPPPAAVAVAAPAAPSPSQLPSSCPLMSLFNNNRDRIGSNSNVHTDLVKPSSFFEPPQMMSSPHLVHTISPLNHNNATHQQRTYGTPVLQPFPPPTPPPSLAPPAPSSLVINKEKVKEALLSLVQENEFIDMVTRALQNAHQPTL